MVLLGILVGGLWWARRQPLPFLAMAAFFGFSFLISNIPTPIETIFGERLYYTPAVGLSFLLAWVADRLWRLEPPRRQQWLRAGGCQSARILTVPKIDKIDADQTVPNQQAYPRTERACFRKTFEVNAKHALRSCAVHGRDSFTRS